MGGNKAFAAQPTIDEGEPSELDEGEIDEALLPEELIAAEHEVLAAMHMTQSKWKVLRQAKGYFGGKTEQQAGSDAKERLKKLMSESRAGWGAGGFGTGRKIHNALGIVVLPPW